MTPLSSMRPIASPSAAAGAARPQDSERQAQPGEPTTQHESSISARARDARSATRRSSPRCRAPGDELRPRLQPVPRRPHAHPASTNEPESLSCSRTSTGAAIGLDFEDDPEVDGPDRVAVVVQQPDELEVRRPVRDELLRPLAPSPAMSASSPIVNRVQVAADADAGLAVQPRSPPASVRSMRKTRVPSRTTT